MQPQSKNPVLEKTVGLIAEIGVPIEFHKLNRPAFFPGIKVACGALESLSSLQDSRKSSRGGRKPEGVLGRS